MQKNPFINDEISFTGKFSNSIFQTISMSIQNYRNKFIFFIILGFLGRAFLLVNANIIGKWADHLCNNSKYCGENIGIFANYNFDDFFKLLLIFSFLGLILSVVFRVTVARMGTYASSLFYDETTVRVSRFPIRFFDTNPLGRIITRFSSDYSAITRMSGGPLTEVLSITFDLILYVIFILIASMYFFPVIVISIYFNYLLYKLNKLRIRTERRELSVIRGPAIAHFAETVQGAKIIRVFGKDVFFKNKFNINMDKYIKQKTKSNMYINSFSLQMAILNVSLLLITGILGIWLVINKQVTVGSLGVAFTFILMTSTTIQVFFEWISALEEALTGIERMDHYLKSEIEFGGVLPSSTTFNTRHKTFSEIEENSIKNSKIFSVENADIIVDNLSLRYKENLPFVLNNISFTINKGEKVGIIGKTGSGKSSLIQAIFHLYPFVEGRILINNYEADLGQKKLENQEYVNLNLFRSAISLISQDPIIFSGTLRENFTINKEISDDEIINVAKLVGLGKMLSNGKKSLDFELQEKGADLSLGEKQLICMARCLLKNSPIVLMDEATSSIDPYSEEILVNATKTFLNGKTQIIVAHRLSTIEDCDRILWLDSGKLIMEGSAQSVLNAFKSFEGTKIH